MTLSREWSGFGFRLVRMKISEKIKRLFGRKPPTQEELAVRAGADAASAQLSIERGNADIVTRADRFNPPSGF